MRCPHCEGMDLHKVPERKPYTVAHLQCANCDSTFPEDYKSPKEFFVEGRYFENSLWAFTFAGIQADRMNRPVEVQLNVPGKPFHSRAHPSHFVRSHLVTQS